MVINKVYEKLARLLKPEIFIFADQYRSHSDMSKEELKKIEFEKAAKTIAYAYHNCSFYKKKFDQHGVHPRDFKKLLDIHKFPITKISELKQTFSEGQFESYDEENVIYFQTTGSTGTPFRFPVNNTGVSERTGAKIAVQEWVGFNQRTPMVRMWRTTSTQKLSQRLKDYFYHNKKLLSIYDADDPIGSLLTDQKLKYFCDEIISFKPKIIEGFVSALTTLGQYILSNNIQIRGIKSIITGAEYLPPESRTIIEEAFNTKVYDRYGNSEASLVAHECEYSNGNYYHVFSTKLLFEIIKEDGKPANPGEIGNVVITDFTNRAMPFIRLDLGDLAIAENENKVCPCGRNFPLVKSFEGRINDVFILPNGNKLITHVWHNLFRSQDYIKEFQIIQKEIDLINVSVVLYKEDKNALFELKKRVQSFLPGCFVKWNIVDKIKVGKGGKFRHSYSEVYTKLNPKTPKKGIGASKNVENLTPYKIPLSQKALQERETSIKIDWNEGTIGPPKKVVTDIVQFVESKNTLNWYPEISAKKLKNEIAKFNDVLPESVELFNGSDGALSYISRSFLNEKDIVSIISPTYDQFRVEAEAAGGFCESIFYENPFNNNISEILNKVSKESKIIYLVNPNNPTGVIYKPSDIRKILISFPNSLVIIDEAYIEFCLEYSSSKLVNDHSNLIITRTFSKAFCLAALRLGYILTQEKNIEIIRRIKNAKEVNSIALIAAESALREWLHYQEYINEVNNNKDKMIRILNDNGFIVKGSQGNFIMIQIDSPKKFITHMQQQKIYVRDRSYLSQLENYVRISVGDSTTTEKTIKTILSYKQR